MGRCGWGILISLVIWSGCERQPPPPVVFEDIRHTIKLSYPRGWKSDVPPSPDVFLVLLTGDGTGTPMPSRLIVSRMAASSGDYSVSSYDTIQSSIIDGLKTNGVSNAVTEEAGSTYLGGEAARRLIISGHSDTNGVDAKSVYVFCVRNGVCYCITGCATPERFARLLADCDEVAGTFEFVKQSGGK